MSAVFFDTWAYIALANARDAGHPAALAADDWVRRDNRTAVTSDYVLDEAITALHAGAHLKVALGLIEMVQAQQAAGELLVIPISADRRASALRWFRRLAPDTPRLSFTDCTSFALLEELKISAAFTPDRHFSRLKGLHQLIQLEDGGLFFRPPPSR